MASANETDRAAAAAADAASNGQNEQREGEANNNNNNEQQPQFNFMSILNWILFFWITQNIAGMMTSKLHNNQNDMGDATTKMAPGNTAGEQQIKKP